MGEIGVIVTRSTGRTNSDPTSQPRVPVLVQLARSRDLVDLAFLLQLYLRYRAVNITSSWSHAGSWLHSSAFTITSIRVR